MIWLIGIFFISYPIYRWIRSCYIYTFDSTYWLALMQNNPIQVQKLLQKGFSTKRLRSKHIRAYLEKMPPKTLKKVQYIEDILSSIDVDLHCYYLLAYCYLNLQIPTAAYRYFQKAGLDPNYRSRISLAFIKRGHYAEAIKWIQQFCSENESEYTKLLQAYIYYRQSSQKNLTSALSSIEASTLNISSIRYLSYKCKYKQPILNVDLSSAKLEYLYKHRLYHAILAYLQCHPVDSLKPFEIQIVALAAFKIQKLEECFMYLQKLGSHKHAKDSFIMILSDRLVTAISDSKWIEYSSKFLSYSHKHSAVALALAIRFFSISQVEKLHIDLLQKILPFLQYPQIFKVLEHLSSQLPMLLDLAPRQQSHLFAYCRYHMKDLQPKVSSEILWNSRRTA